jgi:hypothetical protein
MNENLSVVTYKDNKFAPMEISKIAGYIFLIGISFAVLLFWPFAVIWSLNSLFSLSIQYTFYNWLACVVLIVTMQSLMNITYKNKSK